MTAHRFGAALIGLAAVAAAAAGGVPRAARADFAFVTNQSSEDLSVIDLDRMVEVARVPVPGKPAGVAASRELGAVFTVGPDDKTIRRFDLADLERSGGAVRPVAVATLDGGPIGVAVDPRRRRLFVSDWYNARVWAIDVDRMAIERELTTGAAPSGLAVSPDGRWLAVADRDADQLSIFDAESLTLAHRVAVGVRPFGVSFAPDGRVFTADVGSDTVTAVDPTTGAVVGRGATRKRPYGVAFAAGRVFVTNQYDDSVSVLDAGTLEPVKVIDVGEYPEGIGTTADGRSVVVANWFSNTISVIDAAALTVTGKVATGDGPRAFGLFLAGR